MLFRICTFRIGFGEEVENASGSPSSVQGFRLIGLLRNMVMVPMSNLGTAFLTITPILALLALNPSKPEALNED